jgi:chorismate dehydratase
MLRIGSVPYLNAKPLVDWFHSPDCDAEVELLYDVPSRLAQRLREGTLDVANCSIFELLQNPALTLLPDISISAYGAVKSVRLFSKAPLAQVQAVALDTSSLTSAALTQILLKEAFGAEPRYLHRPPNLEAMLEEADAGLLIGDLNLFDNLPNILEYDLGQGWQEATGLPFVYAAWQARTDRVSPETAQILNRAKAWGVARLEELASLWAERMRLPLDRCQDYLLQVMNYDLTPRQMEGLRLYQRKCYEHGLIEALYPL